MSDAQDGTLLKLEPLVSEAAGKTARKKSDEDKPATIGARASIYNRDPGVGTTQTYVQVDPPEGGRYSLRNAEGLHRIDFGEDGFDDLDLAIAADAEGSSTDLANFDHYPINDAGEALCGTGTNKQFQQVNFFAALTRYRRYALALGVDDRE